MCPISPLVRVVRAYFNETAISHFRCALRPLFVFTLNIFASTLKWCIPKPTIFMNSQFANAVWLRYSLLLFIIFIASLCHIAPSTRCTCAPADAKTAIVSYFYIYAEKHLIIHYNYCLFVWFCLPNDRMISIDSKVNSCIIVYFSTNYLENTFLFSWLKWLSDWNLW